MRFYYRSVKCLEGRIVTFLQMEKLATRESNLPEAKQNVRRRSEKKYNAGILNPRSSQIFLWGNFTKHSANIIQIYSFKVSAVQTVLHGVSTPKSREESCLQISQGGFIMPDE